MIRPFPRIVTTIVLLVAATCTTGADASGAAATAPAGEEAFTILPSREDRVRLGRMLVVFPDGADAGSTRVNVFRMSDPDKQVAGAYGKLEVDLIPGRYRVTIGGAAVDDVEVKPKHDTLIHVGMLRAAADPETRVSVLGPDDKQLNGSYGTHEVGLPVGTYQVRVGKETRPATIEKDKVTDH